MTTAHRDALASAGLLVDEVLIGSAGYSPFADLLRTAAASGTSLIGRSALDAWTEHAKSALPLIREDVAAWVSRLVNLVGVVYELAVAAESEVAATQPTQLHRDYLRAFVSYLTPQEVVGARPKGGYVSPFDPLEKLAAQALGIRDAVAVERAADSACECAGLLPRDVVELMMALDREVEDEGKDGDKETPPTVN